jgi:hypothetical protein
MSEQIIEAKIEEVTPTVQVPVKLFAEPKPLTAEERREIYEQLSQYYDINRLPLPEEFFDEDVTSERGQIQLQYDAHMVGLLNNGMIEMSKEKEETYRKRLAHKIELVRQLKKKEKEIVTILDG